MDMETGMTADTQTISRIPPRSGAAFELNKGSG